MYYVYVLFSEKDKKLYIEYTPDLKIRIEKHNKGFVKATKFRRPLKLVYYESYLEKNDAQNREIFLKGDKYSSVGTLSVLFARWNAAPLSGAFGALSAPM